MANDRKAYQSESILAEGVTVSNDTWSTGINCNQLVLGPTGSGKTRNFLKPNLLQANASYLVLDTKGQLYKEVGPVLKEQGFSVQLLDLAKMDGTIGYDPLDYIRRDANGNPSERDIMTVATALCPPENRIEPFWDLAAANYIASLVAFVLETMPSKMQTMDNVVRVFEQCGNPAAMNEMFESIADTNPESFALRNYRRAKCTMVADRMHSSIMGIIAEKLRCLAFSGATELFHHKHKMDFAKMGHKKTALFVAISDVDYSLAPLTSLFVMQAIQGLEREADACPGAMLPTPVRMFLDDFSNLMIPDFDKIISVVLSRFAAALPSSARPERGA